MEIELPGFMGHSRPGSVFEFIWFEIRVQLRVSNDRRQMKRLLRQSELLLIDEPGESLEPDLGSLSWRVGKQEAEKAAVEADEVNPASVLLDEAYDLSNHFVSRPGAEPRLQAGQFVKGQQC
jgi:hypothetical protein